MQLIWLIVPKQQRLLNRSNFTINKANVIEELSKAVKILDPTRSGTGGVEHETNPDIIQTAIKHNCMDRSNN